MPRSSAATVAGNSTCMPLIEPVSGTVVLRELQAAKAVSASALDGAGHPLGEPIEAKKTPAGWQFPIGGTVTTWYLVTVKR